jgi:hypothetical protein
MHHAQHTVDSVVDSPANDGSRRRAYYQTRGYSMPPLLRLACRAYSEPRATEHSYIDRIQAVCQQAGYSFPRWLIINYYVSLKTNPLVILAGPEGTGKADFTRLMAAGMVGTNADQFALIPGRSTWHTGTGEAHSFRSLHERFTSLRFVNLLHEAATAGNAGKLYMVCFQRLNPDEIEFYLDGMLKIGEHGQRYVQSPELPGNQLIIPPNVRISATVDTNHATAALNKAALRHAGVIDFLTTPIPAQTRPNLPVVVPPGYQRTWLQASVSDITIARQRLTSILGSEIINRMTYSPILRDMIWASGFTFGGAMRQELTIAIANSFDTNGHGLFDPHDPLHNAQIAYDTQLIQRLRWQTNLTNCPTIASYFGDSSAARTMRAA